VKGGSAQRGGRTKAAHVLKMEGRKGPGVFALREKQWIVRCVEGGGNESKAKVLGGGGWGVRAGWGGLV